jgi:hypothetical protein
MKIEHEQISASIEAADAFHTKMLSRTDATENAIKSGMTPASAGRYIDSMCNIFDGRQYKSTISANAIDSILAYTSKKYGGERLNAAILAVRMHLDYYSALPNGGPMRSAYAILAKYETPTR